MFVEGCWGKSERLDERASSNVLGEFRVARNEREIRNLGETCDLKTVRKPL